MTSGVVPIGGSGLCPWGQVASRPPTPPPRLFSLREVQVTARLGLKRKVGLLDTGTGQRKGPLHGTWALGQVGQTGLRSPAWEEPAWAPGADWQCSLCLLWASGASTFPTTCSLNTLGGVGPGSKPVPPTWAQEARGQATGAHERGTRDGPKCLRPAARTSQASAFPAPAPHIHRTWGGREWGRLVQLATGLALPGTERGVRVPV